jgi:D-aminoacyl-tRNA deacylase
MIAVIQRVSEASVKIEGVIKGEIQTGFVVLLGITHADVQDDVEWLSKKIVGLRIFSDEENKMNLDLSSVKGNVLLISQFTLHASTKKGNRPSFIEAARPEIAIPLYEKMILQLEKDLGKTIQTGEFGADMKVSLINDGPVTIILDSKKKYDS